MIYLELWKILLKWSREFTTHEFISTFSPPAPYKILHDMVNHGLLKKKGRSRYRAVPPEELAEAGTDVEAFYRMLRNANLKYALTAEDAVFLWTKGGYNVGRFFGRYPIHIDIKEKDIKSWKEFFKKNKLRYTIRGKPIKEGWLGVFYCLHPNGDVKSTVIDGFPVLPLDDTREFCRENRLTYAPALKMLSG